MYHGAFPDMGPTEDVVTTQRIMEFNSLAGKPPAWVYFSNNWFEGIKFPGEAVETISGTGAMPFIRMMPRSDFIEGKQDPVYTLQNIIDGVYDEELKQYARDARDSSVPIMIEFGTEVNGDWFSWGGAINGGGVTNGYGDPAYPDGPERFRDAYRRIIDIFRGEQANNVTWAFHMNGGSSPEAEWNKMNNYYPGDSYIDWIGVSIYGGQVPGEKWEDFSSQIERAYNEISGVSAVKPIAVFEFGVIEDPSAGSKAGWIGDALEVLESGKYPRIKALSYWHSSWTNDDGRASNMRLDSSPEVLKTYSTIIASPFFVTVPKYSK